MQNPADLPLRDIHLPGPVPWWPPAPGWWLLAALLLLSLAALWWWRRQRASRRRSQLVLAQKELERLVAESDSGDLAIALSAWLRRVSLAIYPTDAVASLIGDDWLAFLDRAAGQTLFRDGPGQVMGDIAYRPAADFDIAALTAICRRWLAALDAAGLERARR